MRIRLGLLSLLLASGISAGELEFQSQVQASTVVELFTSEGCSSCPPADKWLAQFKSQEGLFETFIPMAFHVDYWDYIGWEDPFASNRYSTRQRNYAREGALRSVYTPGFVVNGKEWRHFFRNRSAQPSEPRTQPGILKGELNGKTLNVSFPANTPVNLNVAYLGMGLESQVTAGENSRRLLKHDFVVLDHWQARPGKTAEQVTQWQLELKSIPDKTQAQTALVIWVTQAGSQAALQATGVLLPDNKIAGDKLTAAF